jgi:hypothetical protein
MKKPTPPQPKGNALADSALAAIDQIERDKKRAQLESLDAAREQIAGRIKELEHQLTQINKVFELVNGKPVVTEPRQRRNLDDVRGRLLNWLTAHQGQRYAAGEIIREFPELDGSPVSTILMPLINNKKIAVDKTEGMRRAKYYVG